MEDVRIHYDENKDSIVITSKDKDIPQGKSICLNLNNGRGAEKVLREMLENAGVIATENSKTFPKSISYDSVSKDQPWYAFPLGVRPSRKTVFWDPNTTGNLLIWGQGSFGKENTDNNILRHCVNNPNHWSVSVIDYRAVETNKYSQYRPVVEKVSSTDEETDAIINDAYAEMQARYSAMEKEEVANYLDLENKVPGHLIVIDDIGILHLQEAKDPEPFHRFQDILRMGRSAGIHVVISGRGMGIALSVVSEDFLKFLPSRFITGKVEYLLSQWALENRKANQIGEEKGRGYFQEFGKGLEIQAYVADPDWLDK